MGSQGAFFHFHSGPLLFLTVDIVLLQPPPVLDTTWTPAQNQTALAKHFEKQTALYGKQVILNLAEQHGKEATIVDAYREGVAKLASEDVKCGLSLRLEPWGRHGELTFSYFAGT